MSTLTLPRTLTPNTPENVSHVQENFVALRDLVNGQIDLENLSAALQALLVPTGSVLATARSTAPTGYLLCDGTAVSRTTFAALFSAISTSFGTGDGSTTFNVPDLRGRTPVGVDGAAGRIASNDALGNAAGAETVALSATHLPPHEHFIRNYRPGGTGDGDQWGYSDPTFQADMGHDLNTGETNSGIGLNGTAHANMPPYQIVNWLIKV